MNCYIINLDRSADRLAFMSRQIGFLKKQPGGENINPVRLPAVDASGLSNDETDAVYDKDFDSFNARYFPNVVQPGGLTRGEIACFLSHRKAWQKIVDAGEPYAAVFEDDIIFSDKAVAFLGKTDWIPSDADLIKLEVMTRKLIVDETPSKTVNGKEVVRFHNTNMGAAAYIISEKAAVRLLQLSQRFYVPVDHFMFGSLFPFFGQFNCYQVMPAVCIQDKELNGEAVTFASTLGDRDKENEKRKKQKSGLFIKIKREFIRFCIRRKERAGAKKEAVNSFHADEAFVSRQK